MTDKERDESINNLFNRLGDLNKSLTAISEQNKTIFNMLKDIDKTINGNGRPGLIERVTTLETQSSGANKNLTVVGWLITTLVAIYAAFFKHTN